MVSCYNVSSTVHLCDAAMVYIPDMHWHWHNKKESSTNLSNNDLMVELVVHADSDGILPACLQHPVIARKDWESYENEFINSPDMNPTRNKHVHHVWCLVPVHMCIPYLPRAHVQGVEWLVMSVCRHCPSVYLPVCLLVQRTPVIQAVLLVVKKSRKPTLSVLLFARYTLWMLKIPCFELVLWACLSIPPRYLATCTTQDDGFSVTRVHSTACICEMMVCFYPQGSTCTATWHTGYVFYRVLVPIADALLFSCSVLCDYYLRVMCTFLKHVCWY